MRNNMRNKHENVGISYACDLNKRENINKSMYCNHAIMCVCMCVCVCVCVCAVA